MKQKHFNLIVVIFMLITISYIYKSSKRPHLTTSSHNYVTKEEHDILKNMMQQDTLLAIDLESRVVLAAQEIAKSVVSVNVLKRQTVRRTPYSIFDQFFGTIHITEM